MCVIVYKPAGLKLDKSDIKSMYQTNRDGFGAAYFDRANNPVIYKGLFGERQIIEWVRACESLDLVLHFRLATHGGITDENCHPFAVSTDKRRAVKPGACRTALFHNGVIKGYGSATESDTVDLTCNVIAKLPTIELKKAVLDLTGSKYVIMENGTFHFVGEFHELESGILASNLHWQYTAIDRDKWTVSHSRWYDYQDYSWEGDLMRHRGYKDYGDMEQ